CRALPHRFNVAVTMSSRRANSLPSQPISHRPSRSRSMTHRWRPALLAALFIGSAVLPFHAVPPPPAEPGIEFIGRGMVAGNALDLSGLNGKTICPATDADHTPPN